MKGKMDNSTKNKLVQETEICQWEEPDFFLEVDF